MAHGPFGALSVPYTYPTLCNPSNVPSLDFQRRGTKNFRRNLHPDSGAVDVLGNRITEHGQASDASSRRAKR
jgi:hypothetical protein